MGVKANLSPLLEKNNPIDLIEVPLRDPWHKQEVSKNLLGVLSYFISFTITENLSHKIMSEGILTPYTELLLKENNRYDVMKLSYSGCLVT